MSDASPPPARPHFATTRRVFRALTAILQWVGYLAASALFLLVLYWTWPIIYVAFRAMLMREGIL